MDLPLTLLNNRAEINNYSREETQHLQIIIKLNSDRFDSVNHQIHQRHVLEKNVKCVNVQPQNDELHVR